MLSIRSKYAKSARKHIFVSARTSSSNASDGNNGNTKVPSVIKPQQYKRPSQSYQFRDSYSYINNLNSTNSRFQSTKEIDSLLQKPKNVEKLIEQIVLEEHQIETDVPIEEENFIKGLNPREIRKYLDDHIIGQERLKKSIAVSIYHHYLRLDANLPKLNTIDASNVNTIGSFDGKPLKSKNEATVVDKSNIMLIGPTGSGKTLIAKTTAKLLDVPFSMNDATPFTQAGYVGEDVELCISRLLQNAEYDVEKAQRGIVFIDEIDKIAKRSDAASPNQRDVSGEGVQQGLLRILEGTQVTVKNTSGSGGKRGVNNESFTVDTSNILFICSGAFVGLDKIINDRIGTKGSMGFGAPIVSKTNASVQEDVLTLVEPEDLIRFGFIPEFIGRIPVLASSSQLKIHELAKILTDPKNALIKQYQTIFERSGLELLFHPGAIEEIACLAVKKKTGARGLRRIMESVLQNALYDFPGTELKYLVILPENVHSNIPIKAFRESEKDLAFEFLKNGGNKKASKRTKRVAKDVEQTSVNYSPTVELIETNVSTALLQEIEK